MHTLVVLRHAKSAWPADVADQDRPLNERGRRDAPAAGRWLSSNAPAIDLAICSPAARAVQTWQLVAAEVSQPEYRLDDRIYDASVERLLDIVRELPDAASTVLLIGHNPGLTDLVHTLTSETIELKTSSIAVLNGPDCWADINHGATMAGFETPRG
ncbi:MAG TPA: histidine phosphatase family protein [Pseudonocardiaceae bacterium]|jgi:phosphohistidine phosphatase|nr:histidine phosphatase family protein [Pseudonocardiaceae bacterium]